MDSDGYARTNGFGSATGTGDASGRRNTSYPRRVAQNAFHWFAVCPAHCSDCCAYVVNQTASICVSDRLGFTLITRNWPQPYETTCPTW